MAQKSEKMTKQELRAPDTFQRVGIEAEQWVVQRRSWVGGIALALFLGGAVAAFGSYFSKRGEEKAAKALGEAMAVASRPVRADGLPLMGEEEAPFKTEKERDEALKKALTDFRGEHEGTRADLTAVLALGQVEFRLGNHDAALGALDEYLKQAPKEDALRASALEAQGQVYEAQGKHEQAAAAYERLAAEGTGEHAQTLGQYHRARMLVTMDKKEEAAKVLADLKASHPETSAGRLATERLGVLTAQGVKVPEPTAPAAKQDEAKK